MDPATRDTLTAEAIRSLRFFITSGMVGFLWKGLDRCQSLGVAIPPNARIGRVQAVENVILALVEVK